MRFWITTNPRVAYVLVPWYVPVDQNIEDVFLDVYERLRDTPEETFVCLAIADDMIKGMIVAYCRYKDVFIYQARSQGLASKYVDRVFEGLCHWARGKGYKAITAAPRRKGNTKPYERRWGFQGLPDTPMMMCKEI